MFSFSPPHGKKYHCIGCCSKIFFTLRERREHEIQVRERADKKQLANDPVFMRAGPGDHTSRTGNKKTRAFMKDGLVYLLY